MRKPFSYIIPLLFITACTDNAVEKPVWVNNMDVFSFPNDTLVFKARGGNWKASLQSFTQPVPVAMRMTGDGFVLTVQNKFGITEGEAQLILSKGSHHYYYDLNLQNSSLGLITENDYRSPKTVNPDSSLEQHRMLHNIDEWRNIVTAPKQSGPFYEDIIDLSPVAGTYRAQRQKPLSAFYIQPGSVKAIEVSYKFIKEENTFAVTAGPLKDQYGNTVANGTSVAFVYSDGEQTYSMEAALLNGFANAKIPAAANKQYRLTVKVNETVSKKISLIQ